MVVLVAHAAVEHVGDGFETAVRMVREARQIILRPVGTELVEHQERIEHVQLRRADDARQLDAGAIGCRHALQLAGDAGIAAAVEVAIDGHVVAPETVG